MHLPYEQIHQALTNFISTDARWLLATHFPGRMNHDIRMGNWRPLDLCAEPFRLPMPKLIINEDCKDCVEVRSVTSRWDCGIYGNSGKGGKR